MWPGSCDSRAQRVHSPTCSSAWRLLGVTEPSHAASEVVSRWIRASEAWGTLEREGTVTGTALTPGVPSCAGGWERRGQLHRLALASLLGDSLTEPPFTDGEAEAQRGQAPAQDPTAGKSQSRGLTSLFWFLFHAFPAMRASP